MKRILTLTLAAALLLSALAGCSGGGSQESQAVKTPEEYTAAYQAAIEGARDDEMNEAVPVITSTDDQMADLVLPMVGITSDNAAAFAVAVSPMNIRAYGIVAVLPAEGKSEEVQEGLQGFIDQQKQSFEQYLADQYDIANAARLETLDDGTILLVMCEDQDTVFDAIQDALSA
ncbi:MAG TPA: DUF4358 domain-containing protein [Candidatus Intestinimonas pullistercoris]|uniref:DUF4358 domain-containing protein n=1 Tax=Candidatus Intestinimonas pullistercoris TaxID=2838623 RepID=A0A9D2NXL3_9FIRM|nr:DUF4358 domain-containing protein [uncultured Intestinimonas sp.]HJC40551.1 DUF4358 domain-containing protein [Candidatus Intestinimonas pullistercoris]